MSGPDLATRRLQLFDGVLGLMPRGRLLDLGAGHGKFSVRAADAGWQVTAVDARADRFPVDDRVRWQCQDMRQTDVSGFDLILCLGLWYHLTLPDQLELLQRLQGSPLLLDTHVATDHADHPLSEPVTVDGFEGRYYSESGWEKRVTASWQNTTSFWPTEAALRAMLAQHGYQAVYTAEPWVTTDRTFFLCTPGSRLG